MFFPAYSVSSRSYKGENVTQLILTPVLYYYYVLTDRAPSNIVEAQFDVDHLYPQELFKNNDLIPESDKDCLCNLSLLPKKDNISKSNKSLNEINDAWLIQQIEFYADVKAIDFAKYSNIANIHQLKSLRKPFFEKAFMETRDAKLSN